MLDRFPYEIFSWIIKSTREYFPPLSLALVDEVRPPPIIATHVCRSWRRALLSDPTMWTYFRIPRNDKGQTKELLRRSGSASLDVLIQAFCWRLDPHALAIVLQEMHRIQTLQISFFVDNDTMKQLVYRILPYLKNPAPRLKNLSIAVGGISWVVDEEFPRILFSGHTPNLKHIYLKASPSFYGLFFSPLCQNLFEIHLGITDTTDIHGDLFLDVLELSPQLQIIKITPTSEQENTVALPTYSGRRVHLPYLQRLVLGSIHGLGIEIAGFLLWHLDFPVDNVQFYIRCNDLHVKKNDPESAILLRFLAQRRYTSLSIFPYEENIDLIFSDLSIFDSEFLTQYDTIHELEESFPDFLRTFQLSNITFLRLEHALLKSMSLRNIFTSLVNLRQLHIDQGSPVTGNPASESFLMALMPRIAYIPSRTGMDDGACFSNIDTSQGTTQGQGGSRRDNFSNIPCPSLHTLEINILDRFELSELYFQTIATCAEFRRQAGHPFEVITIRCPQPVIREEVVACMERHEDFPIMVLTNQITQRPYY